MSLVHRHARKVGRLRLSKKHRSRASVNRWLRDVERLLLRALPSMLQTPDRRWFTLRVKTPR